MAKNTVAKDAGETAPSDFIDRKIAELGDWRGETLVHIRAVIRKADPEVVEEVKWRGVPVWSHAGILCTGETYKNAVKMTFAKGASLEDPEGLFNSSLEGNTRRAIDFHEGDVVDEEALAALIRAAVALNAVGKVSGRSRLKTTISRISRIARPKVARKRRSVALSGAPRRSGVAGALAFLHDLEPQRILVAIDPKLLHALDVAGGLALLPQLPARAAEIPGLAALAGLGQRLGVHVRDHQDVAIAGVGHHRGDQTVGVELGKQREAFFDVVRGSHDDSFRLPI